MFLNIQSFVISDGDLIKGKTFLDVFVLFCRASFRDMRILLRLRYFRRVRNDSFHNSKVSF